MQLLSLPHLCVLLFFFSPFSLGNTDTSCSDAVFGKFNIRLHGQLSGKGLLEIGNGDGSTEASVILTLISEKSTSAEAEQTLENSTGNQIIVSSTARCEDDVLNMRIPANSGNVGNYKTLGGSIMIVAKENYMGVPAGLWDLMILDKGTNQRLHLRGSLLNENR